MATTAAAPTANFVARLIALFKSPASNETEVSYRHRKRAVLEVKRF
jgi:hypothetical protein